MDKYPEYIRQLLWNKKIENHIRKTKICNTHGKIFKLTSYHGNANKNSNEETPKTLRNRNS